MLNEVYDNLKNLLSVMQQRRARIHKVCMLKRGFEIDYKQFDKRIAYILVTVSRGDCVDTVKKIIWECAENVLEVSILKGDPKLIFVAGAIYKDSNEIFGMIQNIKKMEYVGKYDGLKS